MNRLPEPPARQPHATPAGQPTPDDQSAQMWNAYDRAILEGRPYDVPTYYKDDSETPKIGTAPPVAQPGRAPMSAKAVDDTSRMIGAGFLTLCAGGAVSAVLHYSGQADPVVVGMIAAAPTGLAVPILALSRLARRAKEAAEAAPPVIHQHYTGPVTHHETTITSHTRGVLARTRNELPNPDKR